MSRLNIAAVPLDICWAEPERNLAAASDAVAACGAGADLVVLPELFSTGFVADVSLLGQLAESDDGPTVSRLRQLAAQYDCAIAGSYLAAGAEGGFTNRGFIVTPEGHDGFYDKRNLFCLSPEAQLYQAGRNEMLTMEYRGWRLGLIVCYDLRFPVLSYNAGERYDCLLVPANWPRARAWAWEHLLIARAIENQAVVVGANRGGRDDYGDYDGLTFIYDHMGRPIGRAGAGGAVWAAAESDDVHDFRRRLPVLR